MKTKNKIIAVCMAFLMTLGAFTCPDLFQSSNIEEAYAYSNTVSVVQITGDNVRVRSSPSTTSSVILFEADEGDVFTYATTVTNSEGSWYRVIYRSSDTATYNGYVFSEYATRSTRYYQGTITCANSCNLYFNKELNNPYISSISAGTTVACYGCYNNDSVYLIALDNASVTGITIYGFVSASNFSV